MRKFRLLAVVAALALVGAACGNDDDDNGDDNGDVTPTTVDDNGTTELSLSQVLSNTIDEDSADYTITLVRGSLQDVLDGRATGPADGTTTTTEDDDNGILDDDDDGTDDTTTTTEDDDNGLLDDDNGTNGTNDAPEGEVDGTVNWADDVRRVMVPTDNGDREVIVSGTTVYVELPDDFEGGTATAGQTDNGEATNDDDDDDGLLDNGVGDDNGEWGQIELSELIDSMSTDSELLVALHDPSSVLRALNQADTDTQTGQPSDEVDGRDTIHWTVNISGDDLDDPVLEELLGDATGTRDGTTTTTDDDATDNGMTDDTDNGMTDDTDNGMTDDTENGAAGAATQDEAETDNGLAETDTDNGMTDDDDGVTTTTTDDDNGVTDTDDGMTTDMGDVEVHVWADEDDEQIVQIAYEIGGMNGTAGQYAVVVELDDLGTDDDIDTPDTDEVRNLQSADLQQVFGDVVIIENGATTGTGTGGGTTTTTTDDDDDDDGLFDDDDDDEDTDDTTTTTQG